MCIVLCGSGGFILFWIFMQLKTFVRVFVDLNDSIQEAQGQGHSAQN